MTDPVKLPTSATSFYTLRRAGAFWDLVLITPMGRKNLRSVLRRYPDRATAEADGAAVAHAALRPFKGGL
jgi:hypothetical protein